MSYPAQSWYDERLVLAPSPVHGRGLFVQSTVAARETVMVWGGTPYSVTDLHAGRIPTGISYSIVDDDLLLAGPVDDLDYFLNHSCDPNVWLGDGLRIIARRDIPAGGEILGDYATWESEPEYELRGCRCGTALCRTAVTGDDWRRPDLQDRYRGHFLPFLQRRIDAERPANSGPALDNGGVARQPL